jgi:protein TonB
MVLFAFNFTVYEYENKDYITLVETEPIFEEVIRTPYEEKKKLPPPELEASENFIDEDLEFIENPLPEPIKTEVKIDTQQRRPSLPKIINQRPKVPIILKPEEPKEKMPPIFEIVEEMPRFPGCENLEMSKKEKKECSEKTLLDYIYSHISYPKFASSAGIEGTAIVQFVINETGKISDLEIVKEIGGGCGKEVEKLVKGMPDWIPGKQLNREVKVRYMLPVKFQLQ